MKLAANPYRMTRIAVMHCWPNPHTEFEFDQHSVLVKVHKRP
jgi:hypothetical protein